MSTCPKKLSRELIIFNSHDLVLCKGQLIIVQTANHVLCWEGMDDEWDAPLYANWQFSELVNPVDQFNLLIRLQNSQSYALFNRLS